MGNSRKIKKTRTSKNVQIIDDDKRVLELEKTKKAKKLPTRTQDSQEPELRTPRAQDRVVEFQKNNLNPEELPARSFKEEKLPPQPFRKKRFAGGSRGDHVAAPQPPPSFVHPGPGPQRAAAGPQHRLPY